MPEQLLDQEIVEQLKSMIEFNPEFGSTVLQLYEQSSGPLLQQLHDLVGSQDFAELSNVAHSLKGASLNIGGHRLGMLLKDLQNAAEAQESEKIRELVEAIPPLKEETLKALEQEFATN